MIGICGAHRVGKTTLAKEIAERLNMPLVVSDRSKIFKEMGMSPADKLAPIDRLTMQVKILDQAVEDWKNAPAFFVSDRTPIDMMAYTLAEVSAGYVDNSAHEEALKSYIDTCYKMANKFFGLIVLIQPGIPYVAAENKGHSSEAYRHHLNYLLRGLIFDPRLRCESRSLNENCTSLEKRIQVMEHLYGDHCDALRASAQTFSQACH